MTFITAQEAVKAVQSGDRVYVHAASMTPTILTDALTDRASELSNVEMCHIHTYGVAKYADIQYKDSFFVNSLFVGANVRHTIKQGNGSYTPIFLGSMPKAILNGDLKVDVLLIQVTEPDEHGYCSLGTSIENIHAAAETARVIIAQVNKYVPRTFGDSYIHASKINYFVENHTPLYAFAMPDSTKDEITIGNYIAELIEDKSCLQMGIGSIPNAVLANLTNHKGLGIHTEMFSDGIIPLVKSGVITGEHKGILKGKIVSTFADGSQELYDFINQNPVIEMKPTSFSNDPYKIAKNNRLISINSAIEVDVTGQVCADSIGTNVFSGVGGQIDFITGASMSKGGKSILALTSTTNKGVNKIVPSLKQGAGVVTSRAHVDYIITEFGVAKLSGKHIRDRVKAMVEIAHPDFRESIEREYFESIK
ncbi:acetyl-CoA hydrolase/transferase family protein [Faecalibacter bovis]|uniref:Acetyl-CoA hydrolase/transferase family protein n=1 Tax=Faecalibacter bovis TaxID=2898187 RepID=A0ABX7XGR1_9FLAO|nr:acetyl-CoA hydrolase/transferase C-terminal domain-containing protein [Faecalibacter bovis]QTV07101.1 acetyl-CoA hydrolase/transferase family protein [Faecalibacter bovis]